MARKLVNTLKWLWRSWPLIVIAIVAALHHALRLHCNFPTEQLSPVISMLCQILGGLLVLYSIDSKMGLFSGNTLGQLFKTYLNQFPFRTQVVDLSGTIQGSSKLKGSLEASWTGQTNTIEKKIEYLQFQLNELNTQLESKVAALEAEINKHQEIAHEKYEKAEENIQKVKDSLQAYAFDDLKIQLFGLLLFFYGSINSYIYAT